MVDVVVGVQWGDEGKGKIVDRFAKDYEYVVRYQGGHNAGHTIVVNGVKYALHLVPSGVLYSQCKNVIANGVVIDLGALLQELKDLNKALNPQAGDDISVLQNRLFISHKAHVILPYHVLLDNLGENKRTETIGTTGKGIGPTYADKVARNGIQIGDLLCEEKLRTKIEVNLENLKHLNLDINSESLIQELMRYAEIFDPFITDTTKLLWDCIEKGKKIMLEGAQGSMLDIDHGTYPFVTSSNTSIAGCLSGTGLNTRDINEVIGITKAYCTRVGNGAFPTELHDDTGDLLREKGFEFGTTTGRERRCGWLDLVAIKHAVRLNGCTKLALMKIDVLDGFSTIKACVGYEYKGREIDYMPYDLDVKPIYKTFKGWDKTTGLKDFQALPKEAKEYIAFIESFVHCKVGFISTSPERDDLIVCD